MSEPKKELAIDEDLDFEDEGYRLEAKIIGEYILAADEELGRTLRQALRQSIHRSAEDTWKQKDTTEVFQKNLAEYLSEATKQVFEQSERNILYEHLKRALQEKWRDTVKDAVENGVREFLEKQMPTSTLSEKDRGFIKKGISKITFKDVLARATRGAVEEQLRFSLRQIILETIKTHISDEKVRMMVKQVVHSRLHSEPITWRRLKLTWKAFVIAVFMLPLALASLVLWTRIGATDQRLDGMADHLAAIRSSIDHSPRPSEKRLADDAYQKPDKEKNRLQSNDLFRKRFEDMLTSSKSDQQPFKAIHEDPAFYFEAFLGFQSMHELRRQVKLLTNKHSERHQLFSRSYLLQFNDNRKIAVYLAQCLVIKVAENHKGNHEWWAGFKGKEDIPVFLNTFQCDGHFGLDTKQLFNHFLKKRAEPTDQFFKKREPPVTEILLLSFLALEGLE